MSNSMDYSRANVVMKCSECLEEKTADQLESLEGFRYICHDCRGERS